MNYHQPDIDQLPTTKQLLRSTVIAFIAALVILFTVVLPAEYAIDPTGIGSLLGLKKMGEIKTQLAEEAAEADAKAAAARNNAGAVPTAAVSTPEGKMVKKDTITKVISPNEGIEIKLQMLKGATATYSWSTQGGPLNYDMHGEQGANSQQYDKGAGKVEQSGTLTPNFDGLHGGYWRNRSENNVTLTFNVTGDYISVKEL